MSRSYDPYSYNLNYEIDPIGSRTDYTYDEFHQRSRTEGLAANDTVQPETRTTQTDWDETLNLPTEERIYSSDNVLKRRTVWAYNSRRQLVSSTQVDPVTAVTRVTTNTYCEDADVAAGLCPITGQLRSVTAPPASGNAVHTTSYTYYSDTSFSGADPNAVGHTLGDMKTQTNALNQVTNYTLYDKAGRLLSSTDPNGVVSSQTYWPRGWLHTATVTPPAGAGAAQTTTYDYWPTGLLKTVTQPDGTTLNYAYDDAHRLTDVTDAAGNTVHYTLDNLGNRTNEAFKDASGTLAKTIARVFDNLGRLQITTGAEQ